MTRNNIGRSTALPLLRRKSCSVMANASAICSDDHNEDDDDDDGEDIVDDANNDDDDEDIQDRIDAGNDLLCELQSKMRRMSKSLQRMSNQISEHLSSME